MWDEFKIDGFETPITSLSFGPPSYSIQQLRTIQEEGTTLPVLRFAVGAEDGVIYEWIKEGKFTIHKIPFSDFMALILTTLLLRSPNTI